MIAQYMRTEDLQPNFVKSERYTSRKLNTVILQDVTNVLLINGSASTENLFDDFNTLVEAMSENFEPTKFVICVVPQSCRTKT